MGFLFCYSNDMYLKYFQFWKILLEYEVADTIVRLSAQHIHLPQRKVRNSNGAANRWQ